jgi:hypothetical protein
MSLIASLESRRIDIEALPTKLNALGIEVPAEIVEANKRTAWPTVDPSVAVDAARTKLENAKNAKEWEAAEQEFAAALSVGQVRTLPDYQGTIQGIHKARIEDALGASVPRLIETLCAEYNRLVPEFTTAVDGIPSLGRPDFNVFSLTPEHTTAMHTAKRNADSMTELFEVYKAVLRIAGVQSVAGFETSASRLGDFEDYSQLYNAAEYMEVYRTNGHASVPTLRPLAPHVAIVLAGGSLNLKHPAEADAQRDRLIPRVSA